MRLGDGLALKLGDVVREEHFCQESTCVITMAYMEGYYVLSARLLVGATECPKTEAMLCELFPKKEEYDQAVEEELKLFLQTPHTRCSCGSVTWRPVRGQYCSDCGEPLPKRKEDG